MTSQQMPPTGPDGFIRIGDEATHYLEDHLRTIVAAVVVIVVVAIAWASVDRMRLGAEIDAQNQLAEIAAVYPGSGKALPEPTIRGAIDKYTAFIADDPSGVAKYMAQFNLGRAYEAVGDSAAAITAFKAAAQGPEAVAAAADMRRAYVIMAGGDKKAAGDAFNEVISRYPGMAPQAATEIARMAEQAGAKDVAIEHYKQIMASYSNSPQAAEAQARIAALGGSLPGALPQTAPAEAAPATE